MTHNALALATMVAFSLPMNAGPDQVVEMVDSIYDFFGIDPGSTTTIATDSTAQGNPGGAELDKNGLPWDERIHSSGANRKNADGSWRSKRGVSDALKVKIEAELRATLAAGPTPTTTSAAGPVLPQTPAATTTPVLPTLNTPALPAVPGANAPSAEYTDFVTFIATHTVSETNPTGRLTADWVTQTLTAYGVADGSMQNLAHRPDLIPTIKAGIAKALGLSV